MIEELVTFYYKHTDGALTCDTEIPGFTQPKLSSDLAKHYGGSYFIAETMTKETADNFIDLIIQGQRLLYVQKEYIG